MLRLCKTQLALACHAVLTTAFAAQRLFALSVSARYRPSQTVPSGTHRARLVWRIGRNPVPMLGLRARSLQSVISGSFLVLLHYMNL